MFGSQAPDRTAEPDAAADAYRRTDEVVRTFAADRYSLRPDDDGLVFPSARPGLGVDVEVETLQRFLQPVRIEVGGKVVFESSYPVKA